MLVVVGVVAFAIKIFVIGDAPPDPSKGKVQNFLTSGVSLSPTPHPDTVKLQEAEKTIEETARERETLKAELTSRGDLDRKYEARRQKIISTLNKNFKGKLKGKGDVTYKACEANSIPPLFFGAIMLHETASGTQGYILSHNNPGGLYGNNGFIYYKSVDAGIYDMAKRIKAYYIDQGLTTVAKFGAKYCPIGASNDPKGVNRHWIPNVTNLYIKLTNEAGGV
jgi:hypothetical protein